MKLIWTTRGLSWGSQILRSGGFVDLLPKYKEAFSAVGDTPGACRQVGEIVALRFPDPLGRKDRSGRMIPHEFVVFEPLVAEIHTVDDGRRIVWPFVADEFAHIWDQAEPMSAAK